MNDSTLNRVIKIVTVVARPSAGVTIGEDTPLVGAGLFLDSVTILELLVAAEKEFGIEIPADVLQEAGALETVGSLVRFVESRSRTGA